MPYRIITGPDGKPQRDFLVPDGHAAIVTGEHTTGVVTLNDGTSYDVTDEVVSCPPEHHDAILHHLERQLVAGGHRDTVEHRDTTQPAA